MSAHVAADLAVTLENDRPGALAKALGKDFKGKVSMVFYAAAIPLSFVSSWVACGLYVLVAVMWLIPDRRIEQALTEPAA